MSNPTGLLASIDEAIGSFFAQWNLASTLIAGLLALVFIYPIFASRDPDTHPFLLARQAQASPIRQPGESATYRSTEIPYGYPLRSGLGIKDAGASKWTTGRDGDLRDVWRQAVNGSKKEDGTVISPPAKITTILGTERVVEHDLAGLTVDINVVGKHLQSAGSRKVAVCLSNSVELLCTVFAGSFYNFSPILVPFHQKPDEASKILSTLEFDTLVAEAGTVALESVLKANRSLKRIIWVAKAGNKHLDWNEVPEGIGGKLDVSTWQDLIEEHKSGVTGEVPPLDKENEAPPVLVFTPTKAGEYELVEYSHRNLMAGTSALQSSLPRTQKLLPTDSLLPTLNLSSTYALSWALLALYSASTLLLNSVSGPGVSLTTATKSARQKLKPTHIVADARSIPAFLGDLTSMAGSAGLGGKYAAWRTGRAVAMGICSLKHLARRISLSVYPHCARCISRSRISCPHRNGSPARPSRSCASY